MLLVNGQQELMMYWMIYFGGEYCGLVNIAMTPFQM